MYALENGVPRHWKEAGWKIDASCKKLKLWNLQISITVQWPELTWRGLTAVRRRPWLRHRRRSRRCRPSYFTRWAKLTEAAGTKETGAVKRSPVLNREAQRLLLSRICLSLSLSLSISLPYLAVSVFQAKQLPEKEFWVVSSAFWGSLRGARWRTNYAAPAYSPLPAHRTIEKEKHLLAFHRDLTLPHS